MDSTQKQNCAKQQPADEGEVSETDETQNVEESEPSVEHDIPDGYQQTDNTPFLKQREFLRIPEKLFDK